MDRCLGVKKRSKRKLPAPRLFLRDEATVRDRSIEVVVPVFTVSEANCFEHWTAKSKRHSTQKFQVRMALQRFLAPGTLPCQIVLTRYAPHRLDKRDNLPMAFKYITDQICELLIPGLAAGRADDDDRISVTYAQEESTRYGIKIKITW